MPYAAQRSAVLRAARRQYRAPRWARRAYMYRIARARRPAHHVHSFNFVNRSSGSARSRLPPTVRRAARGGMYGGAIGLRHRRHHDTPSWPVRLAAVRTQEPPARQDVNRYVQQGIITTPDAFVARRRSTTMNIEFELNHMRRAHWPGRYGRHTALMDGILQPAVKTCMYISRTTPAPQIPHLPRPDHLVWS